MSGFDIGSVHLAGRTVLAPMAGVSDAAFRTLCLEQGAALDDELRGQINDFARTALEKFKRTGGR